MNNALTTLVWSILLSALQRQDCGWGMGDQAAMRADHPYLAVCQVFSMAGGPPVRSPCPARAWCIGDHDSRAAAIRSETVRNTPFTNLPELGPPNRLAISTASLIAALNGTFGS